MVCVFRCVYVCVCLKYWEKQNTWEFKKVESQRTYRIKNNT